MHIALRELLVRVCLAGCLATPLPLTARAQSPTVADARPTVAVMDFDNAALLRHSDYESIGKGIAGILNTELSANSGLRVVDRQSLHQLLEEQKLGSSDRVSPETAVRIGKLLGAHHMIFGSVFVDLNNRMRVDVRSVNVETSQLEYATSRTDAADNIIALVTEVARTMNKEMKLPAITARPKRTSSAPVPAGNRSRAVLLYSRALEQRDRGNIEQATTFCREALSLYPDLDAAQKELARLQTPGAGAGKS